MSINITDYINYPAVIEFCKNLVIDPTTSANNRDPIPIAETNNGWVPFGIKPSRQTQNQLFYEHGNWTVYQKDTLQDLQNSFNTFLINSKNGLNIHPGFITTDGNVTINFNSVSLIKNSVIMFDPTTGAGNKATVKLFTLDNTSKNLSQSWDNTTGLTATAITGNTWNYLFAVGNDAGATDYALDDNEGGTNVIANVIGNVPQGDYKYMRLMAVVPVINDGSNKFPEFEYGVDDYIYYGDNVALSVKNYTGVNGLPGTTHTFTLSNTFTSIDALPLNLYGQIKLRLKCPAGAATTARVSYNGSSPLDIGLSPIDLSINDISTQDAYAGIPTSNCKIKVEAVGGPATTSVDVSVMAYKNPAVSNEIPI